MVKCSECNTELEENAKFCPDCGAKVEIIEAEVVNEETQAIRGTKFCCCNSTNYTPSINSITFFSF